MSDKKKFGLVMPKRAEAIKMSKNSVFDDDSNDDEKSQKRPKIPQKKIISKVKIDSMEDPSIYEYDDIYDDMKRQQKESIAPKEKKNSRYIETLMKAAEKKKKEFERRLDKKIQAEREKEGDQFKDKEAFVTSSYKKKMQEQEEEEERERRESMLNDMMDVTKQKDLSGFYRHFLKQTVGEEKVPQFGERKIKEEVVSDEEASHKTDSISKDYEDLDRDSDNVEIDGKDDEDSEKQSDTESQKRKGSSDSEGDKLHSNKSKRSRIFQSRKRDRGQYRKHKEMSNKSSDSSDSEEDNMSARKRVSLEKRKGTGKSIPIDLHKSRHDSSSSSQENSGGDEEEEKTVNKDENTKENTISEKKVRPNIYAKRTVGDLFAAAQARYFQRMAERMSKIT